MRYLANILFVLVLVSCNPEEPSAPSATPYTPEYPFYFGDNTNIPVDNPLTVEGIELGRHLFYEKNISIDSTVSCASCHKQELSFTDGVAFSVGVGGTVDRSSMSITNALWGESFFWDGRAATLEQQALAPIENPIEMNLSIPEAVSRIAGMSKYPPMFEAAFGTKEVTAHRIAKAISQFERTLISSDSKYDKYLQGEYTATDDEKEGILLFFTHPEPLSAIRGGNCGDCHGSQQTFQGGFHNNGMDTVFADLGRELVTGDPNDRGKFKAPSLRNIVQTAPYMHDGRFATLEEVLDHYNEHILESSTLDPLISNASNIPGADSLALTDDEKQKIILFLHMLTDSTFLCNLEFSDPN